MRSLIIGATGQIGSQLLAACEARDHATLGTWYRFPNTAGVPIDLRDDDAVRDLLHDFQPDVVYLAAGMNQVDYAETQPAECHELNAHAAANLAKQVADSAAKFVMISSSHVLGECPTSRREDVAALPVNEYGRAMLAAENAVRAELPERHWIIRTSAVYGPEVRGRNVALHTLRRLSQNVRLKAATDRFIQPTYGPDLAATVLDLVTQHAPGLYHVTGPERISEHALTTMVAFNFGYDADLVQGVPSAKLHEDAPRAKSQWLDRAKLRAAVGAKTMRSVGDGLRDLRRRLSAVPAVARAA